VTFADELGSAIAFALERPGDEEDAEARLNGLARRDPKAAFEVGARLAPGQDPDLAAVSVMLVGLAAEADRAHGPGALTILRDALASPDVGPRLAAVKAIPAVDATDSWVTEYIDLSRDTNDEIRDWATFALASRTDADDEAISEALLARTEDPCYEARIGAIVGLVKRGDPRVRQYLDRELRDPDHAEIIDAAVEFLDRGVCHALFEPLGDSS
jgi:HEAT repeat protein